MNPDHAAPSPASPQPASPAGAVLDPRGLSAIAKRLYTSGPVLLRALQHYRPFICPFHQLLPIVPPGSTILDVGCGGGLWLILLRESARIARGVGFDSSSGAIKIAHLAATPHAHSLDFLHSPAQAPWPDGPFDVVSIIDVLHHVPPAVAPVLFEHAFARLRPGGLLIYKDIYPGSWRSLCNRAHDLVMARQWIHLAAPERVEAWAKAAGFATRSRRRTNMLWYGHELFVFERPDA